METPLRGAFEMDDHTDINEWVTLNVGGQKFMTSK